MVRCALLLVVLAACPAGGDDDYPIIVGGGGGGPSNPSNPDASGGGGVDAPDGTIFGRVCRLTELRRLLGARASDCLLPLADSTLVKLGATEVAPDRLDGTFAMPAQSGENLAWTVTGGVYMTSVIPAAGAWPVLPVIDTATYTERQSRHGILAGPQHGGLVVRVLKGNVPVSGATAKIDNGESAQTFYDSDDDLMWGETSTGALGLAWLPDNMAGSRVLIVSKPPSSVMTEVVLVAEQLTFVTVSLP